jgi:hypothetical protein
MPTGMASAFGPRQREPGDGLRAPTIAIVPGCTIDLAPHAPRHGRELPGRRRATISDASHQGAREQAHHHLSIRLAKIGRLHKSIVLLDDARMIVFSDGRRRTSESARNVIHVQALRRNGQHIGRSTQQTARND